MKKVLVIVLALVLSLTAFSACTQPVAPVEKTGEAYTTVHGAGYVGKATVTVLDGKVTKATLEEACFPSQVVATADVPAADKVVVGEGAKAKSLYKTVKFAGVTAICDSVGYKVDGVEFKVWAATEANAKKYYDAVEKNEVSVVVGGVEKKDVLTAKTLIKSLNDYGKANGFDWAKNQKATIDYVVKNGFENAASLTFDKTAKTWTDSKGVVATGATWSDMNTVKDGSTSYIKLLSNAFDKTKA